jgi:tetratricopeptide (TPR) repeat protein
MEAMEAASRHHNKRFLEPARCARFWAAAALAAFALTLLTGIAPLGSAAQQKKSPETATRASKHPAPPPSVNRDSPGYARLLASDDLEVGKFYLNKHKYDAAISRFDSAVKHDPGWADPYELLGEAYEKKDDPKQAIAGYRKYLDIKPYAKDAKKIEERIEKLTREAKAQEDGGQ